MSHIRTAAGAPGAVPAAPSRERLIGEAGMLVGLLELHSADRDLLRRQGRLVQFIDSHELKAYLNASEGDFLEGFLLDAEKTLMEQANALDRYQGIRLKSEHVLQWLLFDQPDQVILLPSHGEEMDEEIAYQARRVLARHLGLLNAARAQLKSIRERVLSNKLLATYAEKAKDDPRSRQVLIDFLSESAPALAALLRIVPDTIDQRIDLLAEKSQLVLLEDVDWSEFGFEPAICDSLRSYAANPPPSEDWRSVLSRGRGNSYRSNRVDADAVAFLSGFNDLLSSHRLDARGVLVTRATTLINLIRSDRHGRTRTREAATMIRHSRLLAGSRSEFDGATPGPSGRRVEDALDQLLVALKTYERQLAAPSATAEVAEATVRETEKMVAAWNEFESARLTLELARVESATGTDAPAVSDEGVLQLLAWLQSDQDVEALVADRLDDRIGSFRRTTFSKYPLEFRRIPVHLQREPGMTRVRVRPVTGAVAAVGPILFDTAYFAGGLPEKIERDVVILLELPGGERTSSNIAEDYLFWAMLHGCRSDWLLAEIYAESAILSARLLHQRATEDEGRLLFAQALRLGGPRKDRSTPFRRFERARQAMSEFANPSDGRIRLERAAQNLELALTPETAPAEVQRLFDAGLEDLHQSFVAGDADEMKAEVAELTLIFLLATRHGIEHPQMTAPALLPHVLEWHRVLVERLAAFRLAPDMRVPEEIPHQTQAMEILGYEFARQLLLANEDPTAARMEVPSFLRVNIDELHGRMHSRTDRIGQMIRSALTELISRTGGARNYALSFAPVWEGAGSAEAIGREEVDPELRTAALEASRIVHDAGEYQLAAQGDVHELAQLERARELFDSVLEGPPAWSPDALHRLQMERAYAALLRAYAESNADEKTRRYERIEAEYRDLLERYPDSVALRYRYSIVLTELSRDKMALDAVQEALRIFLEKPADTFRNHWVYRTMRRRMAFLLAREARTLWARVKTEPENPDLRQGCLTSSREAFRVLYHDFLNEKDGGSSFARLEHQRSINNIVYYASIYLDAGGNLADLAEGFDRAALIKLVRQLYGESLRDVAEWNVVHTIAFAYHALGERGLARAAADHLIDTLSNAGANADHPSARGAINDAMAWKRADERDEPPLG